MNTSLFARKSILSTITSVFTIVALLVQLVSPLVVWAEEGDGSGTTDQTAQVSDTAQDTGEVLGDQTTTVSDEDQPVTDDTAKEDTEQSAVTVDAPSTATVSATIVYCDTESTLPNWGATNQAIDSGTAEAFIADHPNCHTESGWNFEWSPNAVGPGDNAPAGYVGWNLSPATDGSGVSVFPVTAGIVIGVREVPQYPNVTFSGIDDHHNGVSAEFVCGAPSSPHQFNNRESLGTTVAGETYHCIGFNAPRPVVEETPTATLVATKIVCNLESDLPDLAATNTPITATTASDFLATHPGCHAQAGWNFQWSHKDVASPGDNYQLGKDGWNLVGPTGADGTVTAAIPAVNDLTVREERRAGYIGFSGIDNHHNGVSAEMLCSTPPEGAIHRYDNREPLGALTEGGTVYCVAFNPVLPSPANNSCDANVNLIQNGDFESPTIANGTYSIVQSSNPVLQWLTSWLTPQTTGILGLEIQNHVAGSPFSGNQYAELDGDHPVTTWQNIPTIVGKEYKLTYQYSARPHTSAADNTVQVKINGVVVATNADDGTALGDTNWKAGSVTFIATTASTKVEFSDGGVGTVESYGGYLDNVSVACQGDPVPPTPSVTIDAQKVICNSESDLPNWGLGGHVIDGTTAQSWVNTHEGCHLDPNWKFQWGDQTAPDMGRDFRGEAGSGYTTFTAGSINLPIAPGTTELHLREVLPEGYIPFTFDQSHQSNSNNVSAEFYCTGDALNYDNWDFLRNPVNGTTYHCVGFNTPTVIQTGDQTPPTNPTRKSSGSIGGFMDHPNTLGEVLGASTDAVDEALAQCGEYIHSYIKRGQDNDKSDVVRLQAFLNQYLGTKLVANGVYDYPTFTAVRQFQVKTAAEVLEPWKNTPGGINENGTGYVFKTTKRMINMIKCPALNIEMPTLR